MIYSKLGIVVMFFLSLIGLYVGIEFGIKEDFVIGAILGFLLFIEITYVWVECLYSEMKYRKLERKRNPKPVIILHRLKIKGEK